MNTVNRRGGMNRMQTGLANFLGHFSQQNVLRAIYLTNILIAVAAVIVYLFELRIPNIVGTVLPDWMVFGIGYLIVFAIWMLLEYLTIVENSTLLSGVFSNAGLRWFDLSCVILAAVLVALAVIYGFGREVLYILAAVVVINAFLSYQGMRTLYNRVPINNGPAQPTPTGAQAQVQPVQQVAPQPQAQAPAAIDQDVSQDHVPYGAVETGENGLPLEN